MGTSQLFTPLGSSKNIEKFLSHFPPAYWSLWAANFGHDFYWHHIRRSFEIAGSYLGSYNGKTILEVGGYPGLMIAMYLEYGCKPTAIDSPDFRPLYYLDLLKSWGVESVEHNINCGAIPTEKISHTFDASFMIDVLMHNNGLSPGFMAWWAQSANDLYLINDERYQTATDRPIATEHSLYKGWNISTKEVLIDIMSTYGATYVDRGFITEGQKLVLHFNGAPNGYVGNYTALRGE